MKTEVWKCNVVICRKCRGTYNLYDNDHCPVCKSKKIRRRVIDDKGDRMENEIVPLDRLMRPHCPVHKKENSPMNDVYMITIFKFKDRDDAVERSRTVGVFATNEAAREVLLQNRGDLNEAGYYPLAVIEKIEIGLYPQPEQMSVWKFDNGWQKQPCPGVAKTYLSKFLGFCVLG